MPMVAITMDIRAPGHGSSHHHHAINSISTSLVPLDPGPDPLQLPAGSPALCQAAYPGTLSLHNYRKQLSDGDSFLENHEGKSLRRRNAAFPLSQHPMHPQHSVHPFSVSSMQSSPPPLSPSYSPSAASAQGPESLHGFVLSPNVEVYSSDNPIYSKQNPHKLLDTFRDRLEKYPDPNSDMTGSHHKHTRTRSDSILLNMKRPTATIFDHGTSFEILNPHDSLNVARIVSFIEDVDRDSTGNHRESYIEVTNDTLIIAGEEPPQNPVFAEATPEKDETQVRQEIVGDSPHRPMPSISELLETKDSDDVAGSSHSPSPRYTQKRPIPLRPRAWTDDSDLGEPGSPIRDDGEYPSPMSFPVSLSTPSPFSMDGNSPIPHAAAFYDINYWHGVSGYEHGQGFPHPLYSNPPSPYAMPSPFLPQQPAQDMRIHHNISKQSLNHLRKGSKSGSGSGPFKPFRRLYNAFCKKRR
ncbi:hypothetical protein BO70DRAFT_286536 [Aspergillus heteromorphus CBS 117.55]|uniref:Uncharacterized protein n=1 Tax=Aspergillus heteromorphus CBS 117.55 TaxID=1448321 RepID=A0A317WTV4_9EURO|nr:uncharacterized protein BO70DRAFT_286536 [Aspergillus heteromorphus CBS 117.55]PWY88368.1 hypothetical protein BO70DRAFT_286536 [Aspergillus heteromorphus CBS 117.55]